MDQNQNRMTGYLSSQIVTSDAAMRHVMLSQGTEVTVLNVEEEGHATLVEINPQETIKPPIKNRLRMRIQKSNILLRTEDPEFLWSLNSMCPPCIDNL